MTEKKNMVEIGGKRVLTRDEAERAIRLADPEEVVSLAFCAASASAGGEGKAILDLTTGEVCARAADPPTLSSADRAEDGVALWRVSSATYGMYHHDMHARDEPEIAETDVEAALAREYVFQLSHYLELPDYRDFLHVAQEGLDRVYGTGPDRAGTKN